MTLVEPLTAGKYKRREAKRDALVYAAREYGRPGTRAAREAALAALLEAALECAEAEEEAEARSASHKRRAPGEERP